ncbi:MAG: BLUF domain-containing protein [Candidatus Delongbacteria bacterium]|nr:BLUF domain-containing protein [Candidatus Delongbacteria bacterium]
MVIEEEKNLSHLIYASRSEKGITEKDILDILKFARKNNKAVNVTGMLLFDSGSFLQVLEGDEEELNKLFKTISKDKRHTDIVKIVNEAIPERKFKDWSMGYASLSKSELMKIDGLNDFFHGSSCLTDLDEGRAKKILIAFAEGRWRLE